MKIHKLHLATFIMCVPILCQPMAIRLPEKFHTIKPSQDTRMLELTADKEPETLCIFVPGSYVSVSDKNHPAQDFLEDITIPKHFFRKDVPTAQTKPTVILFDYQESDNTVTRKAAAKIFAKGVNELKNRFQKTPCVVMGHLHGCNIINMAEESLLEPLDTVVHLAPPVFPDQQKYSAYQPKKTKSKRGYNFCTKQAQTFQRPTLHPNYEARYKNYRPWEGHYNILVLVDNKQPTPINLMDNKKTTKLSKKILPICQKARNSFAHHSDLVVHVSDNPKIDKVVAIDTSAPFVPSTFQTNPEKRLSDLRTKNLERTFGRKLALHLSPSEITREQANSIKKMTEQTRTA